jgi:threonine synthase
VAHQWCGVIEEYRDRLPVNNATPVVTLCEGGTPLVESTWLSELTRCWVYLKIEGANPTGSFKDRGMTVAMSKVAESGVKAVICASTGNTSASAAAYAVRAGIYPVVLVPEGKIAAGKLAQAILHGAQLVQVHGNFDDCQRLACAIVEEHSVALVNSANPDGFRVAGQKTAAFEIVDALGDGPDVHVLPVGNGGNITAYWAGYVEYALDGLASRRPRMWGFQAAGSAPIVTGAPVPHPDTVATAIRVGNPARWADAVSARDESGGLIEAVTDQEILHAQAELARREGVFVEPASATGVAGLLAVHRSGRCDQGQRVVITVTGHGLKDIDTPLRALGDISPVVVPVDVAAASAAIGVA